MQRLGFTFYGDAGHVGGDHKGCRPVGYNNVALLETARDRRLRRARRARSELIGVGLSLRVCGWHANAYRDDQYCEECSHGRSGKKTLTISETREFGGST